MRSGVDHHAVEHDPAREYRDFMPEMRSRGHFGGSARREPSSHCRGFIDAGRGRTGVDKSRSGDWLGYPFPVCSESLLYLIRNVQEHRNYRVLCHQQLGHWLGPVIFLLLRCLEAHYRHSGIRAGTDTSDVSSPVSRGCWWRRRGATGSRRARLRISGARHKRHRPRSRPSPGRRRSDCVHGTGICTTRTRRSAKSPPRWLADWWGLLWAIACEVMGWPHTTRAVR